MQLFLIAIVAYIIVGFIVAYLFLEWQEKSFDEYLTNDYEMFLIKKKLGIADTRHFHITKKVGVLENETKMKVCVKGFVSSPPKDDIKAKSDCK